MQILMHIEGQVSFWCGTNKCWCLLETHNILLFLTHMHHRYVSLHHQ